MDYIGLDPGKKNQTLRLLSYTHYVDNSMFEGKGKAVNVLIEDSPGTRHRQRDHLD